MKVLVIAHVAHMINLAYCASLGDNTQPAWEDAPEWQKQSAIAGVEMHLANPDATPEQSHESWLAQKKEQGWKYGKVKDAEKKEHPCFLPYDELPPEQKAKDYLFRGVVHALKGIPDADDAVAEAVDALKADLAQAQQAPAIQTQLAQPTIVVGGAGMMGVKYIGRRDVWKDTVYRSGLSFTAGQTRAIPPHIAKKLLAHRDLFEEAEAPDTVAAAQDDTQSQLDDGKKRSEQTDQSKREFAVIDQVNQMTDKNVLVDYAMNTYQLKVPKNKSIEAMRAQVVEHINRVGVV